MLTPRWLKWALRCFGCRYCSVLFRWRGNRIVWTFRHEWVCYDCYALEYQ